MSKARLVITAVVLEGRAVSEVVEAYGVSRSWVYELVARYRSEGEMAFEPRSRRPKRSPTATDQTIVTLICELRQRLFAQGLDGGADTIAWHLEHDHGVRRHPATIHRILVHAGLYKYHPEYYTGDRKINATKMGEWHTASHVERQPKAKEPGTPAPPTP